MPKTASNLTALLKDFAKGKSNVEESLFPLVYDELHRLARIFMAGERNAKTLQPTALVNEAYVRLVQGKKVSWQNRSHFFAIAAKTMRRVLLDNARAKKAAKRGSGEIVLSFDEAIHSGGTDADLEKLEDALVRLEKLDPRLAQVVELRYYSGLTLEEIADIEKVSLSTVKRDWNAAKLWLYRELSEK